MRFKPIDTRNAGIDARKKAHLPQSGAWLVEEALSQQNRGAAQADVVGEGKLPDGQVMAAVSCLMQNENGQLHHRGQRIKAFLKQVVGFAVDVLHIELFFAEVVVEPLVGGVGMGVQSQDEAVGQQHPQQQDQQP
jgi:hypothetical protein